MLGNFFSILSKEFPKSNKKLSQIGLLQAIVKIPLNINPTPTHWAINIFSRNIIVYF
jgi:hypothetical protein